jgi:hypothetical protein
MNIEYTFNQSLHTIKTSAMGFTGIRPTLGSTLHKPLSQQVSLTLEFLWNLTELLFNFIINFKRQKIGLNAIFFCFVGSKIAEEQMCTLSHKRFFLQHQKCSKEPHSLRGL